MKNTMIPKFIFGAIALLACRISPASAEILEVFATGVNPADATTYNNIQQGRRPTCWAAAGSNVIGHWQKYHAPQSAAPQSAQEVYDTYLSVYHGYTGGTSDTLYRWWLGHYSPAAMGGYYPTEFYDTAGAYYKDIYTQEKVDDLAWRYAEVFKVWESESYYTTDLSRAIYYALSQGNPMAANIPNARHAITIYGATFDTDTNLLTSVYVCDSSGASFDEMKISRIRVGLRTNNAGNKYISLIGDYYENNDFAYYDSKKYLEDIYFLGNSATATRNFVFSIPEPSVFGLLAGAGALAIVASRRRR